MFAFFIFYPLSRTPPNNNHCQDLLWKHHRPPKSQLYIDSNLINTAVDSCQTEVRRSNYLQPYQVIGWVGWEQAVHHGNHKEALSNSGGYSIEYLHHSYPHLIFFFFMIKRPFIQSVLGDSHNSVHRWVTPSFRFLLLFPLHSGSLWCWSLSQLSWGEGRVTSWTSHLFIAGPPRQTSRRLQKFRILD